MTALAYTDNTRLPSQHSPTLTAPSCATRSHSPLSHNSRLPSQHSPTAPSCLRTTRRLAYKGPSLDLEASFKHTRHKHTYEALSSIIPVAPIIDLVDSTWGAHPQIETGKRLYWSREREAQHLSPQATHNSLFRPHTSLHQPPGLCVSRQTQLCPCCESKHRRRGEADTEARHRHRRRDAEARQTQRRGEAQKASTDAEARQTQRRDRDTDVGASRVAAQ